MSYTASYPKTIADLEALAGVTAQEYFASWPMQLTDAEKFRVLGLAAEEREHGGVICLLYPTYY